MLNGILRFSKATAILLVVSKAFYEADSVSQDILFEDELPMIKWTLLALTTQSVEVVGGHHQFYMIKRWKEQENHDLKKAEAVHDQLELKRKGDNEATFEMAEQLV
jgi:hypothetical protein